LCNIILDKCDDPYEPYDVTSSHRLIHEIATNPAAMKQVGYYPLKNNIFHQLEFCHERGINASTPVEPLHCVLLGLFIRLLQGFNRLRRDDMTIPESSNREAHFIFTGVYKDKVQSYLKNIGYLLRQQCDPDMPRTFFPSGYLPDAHDDDDNSTGKKMAHEMRGVLLVILLFMLSDKHKKSLLQRVGEETLSQYVQLFELTIMFECWLDHDEFTREELQVATQFIPILIQTLVNNVKRKKNGLKLPKIHQLQHFVEQIYDFGSASNISGRIGETNLKEKVK